MSISCFLSSVLSTSSVGQPDQPRSPSVFWAPTPTVKRCSSTTTPEDQRKKSSPIASPGLVPRRSSSARLSHPPGGGALLTDLGERLVALGDAR